MSVAVVTGKKDAQYGSRHQEAVKIFNNLLSQETLADPIKLVQNILNTCFDIVDLQSEVWVDCLRMDGGWMDEWMVVGWMNEWVD